MLKNKTVVISGIGPGLGQELAYGAAEHGANCVLAARSKISLPRFKKKLLKTVVKQLVFLQTLPIRKIVKT